MEYIDKIKNLKHKWLIENLLDYIFSKFEASEADKDFVFETLAWDLGKMDRDIDTGLLNGYSEKAQLDLAIKMLDRGIEIEEEKRNKKDFIDEVLDEYSKNP